MKLTTKRADGRAPAARSSRSWRGARSTAPSAWSRARAAASAAIRPSRSWPRSGASWPRVAARSRCSARPSTPTVVISRRPPTSPSCSQRVNDVAGLQRIRFTTSNPYNLTPKLIRAMRDVPKVCEYFHLPLQSGSDRVLERMNRGYTRAQYLALIDALREAEPDDGLLHGHHRGVPRRDRGRLRGDAAVAEQVGYDNVFVFRYSRRPGTPAADMPEQVPEPVKAERNAPHPRGDRAERRGREPAPAGAHGRGAGRRRVAQERRRAVRTHALQSGRELRRDRAGSPSATSSTSASPTSCRTACEARWQRRRRPYACRDEGPRTGPRSRLQHADHHPARRGGQALVADLGRASSRPTPSRWSWRRSPPRAR